MGVVLYSSLTLVPSSRGTTSLGADGAPASWAWCSAPRKPLFLRRGAPRLWGRMGLRQVGRGALLPANPCSFVVGHHVSRVGWGAGKLGVVLRSPLTLVPSSRGTTSLGSDGLTARRFLKSDASAPVFLLHASTSFSMLMHVPSFFHLMHHSNHFYTLFLLL